MITYSQDNAFQDVFADFINEKKTDGFVVDLGCKGLKHNNSLLFLEKGWSGFGVDILDYSSEWVKYPNYFHQMDVTIKKNIDYLFSKTPEIVDFLSFDVDGATFSCLNNMNFEKTKFRCICIEHDYYLNFEKFRQPQRELLHKYGYRRVIQTLAEDWWVKPELISENVNNILNKIPEHKELNAHSMTLILEWLKIN